MKNMKKKVSLMLVFLISASGLLNVANATTWNISFNYSNYNWDQKLQVSWWIDTQIDAKLSKLEDYYSQFKFLKKLTEDTLVKLDKTKAKNDKNKLTELINYYNTKADLVYKLSTLTNKDDITKVKNTFKTAIKTKDTTLNKVIDKVNNTGKISIDNDNQNFEELTQADFDKSINNMIDEVKVNKYKTNYEIIKESKIITLDDFKKIKDILTDNIKFTDEFWNDIKWWIEYSWWWSKWYYAGNNNKLISIFNEEIWEFSQINKDDLNDSNLLNLWELYNIFEDDNVIYNYLKKIEVIWKVNKDHELIVEKVLDNNKNLKWFYIHILGRPITKTRWKFGSRVYLYISFWKDWTINKNIWFLNNDYIYIWNASEDIKYLNWKTWKNKIYTQINYYDGSITFWTISNNFWSQEVDLGVKFNPTKSNINIVFEDWTKITSKWQKYDLKNFKKVINKKISKINIDWEDITSGLLLEKWSIINLYK